MLYLTNWDSTIWISSMEALLRVLGVGASGGFNVVCLVKTNIVIPTTSFFVPKARITTTNIFKTATVTPLPLGLPTLSSTSPPPSTRLPPSIPPISSSSHSMLLISKKESEDAGAYTDLGRRWGSIGCCGIGDTRMPFSGFLEVIPILDKEIDDKGSPVAESYKGCVG